MDRFDFVFCLRAFCTSSFLFLLSAFNIGNSSSSSRTFDEHPAFLVRLFFLPLENILDLFGLSRVTSRFSLSLLRLSSLPVCFSFTTVSPSHCISVNLIDSVSYCSLGSRNSPVRPSDKPTEVSSVELQTSVVDWFSNVECFCGNIGDKVFKATEVVKNVMAESFTTVALWVGPDGWVIKTIWSLTVMVFSSSSGFTVAPSKWLVTELHLRTACVRTLSYCRIWKTQCDSYKRIPFNASKILMLVIYSETV